MDETTSWPWLWKPPSRKLLTLVAILHRRRPAFWTKPTLERAWRLNILKCVIFSMSHQFQPPWTLPPPIYSLIVGDQELAKRDISDAVTPLQFPAQDKCISRNISQPLPTFSTVTLWRFKLWNATKLAKMLEMAKDWFSKMFFLKITNACYLHFTCDVALGWMLLKSRTEDALV